MQLNNVFLKIKDILETLSFLTVIIATIFGFYQYLGSLKRDKINNVLEYNNRFNSNELLKSKHKIENAWSKNRYNLEILQRYGIKDKKVIDKFTNSIITNYNLQKDIDNLVDFYNNLSICIKSNICDKKSAIIFFKDYANRFYKLHKSYIQKQDKFINDYSSGLKYIINLKNE